MTEPSENRARLPIESDGELIGQIFCTFCGNLNEIDAEVCTSCGQYIADQGPDLSARLRRIRRHASQSPELDAKRESTGALMGVDAPPREARWQEAIATRFGPYTGANLILLAGWFLFGLGVIAIFHEAEWQYVIGIFFVAALCCVLSAVSASRRS